MNMSGHRVIVFRKCVKLLAERPWQIWRRCAPPLFRYLGKTVRGGGVEINPPPMRGLRSISSWYQGSNCLGVSLIP